MAASDAPQTTGERINAMRQTPAERWPSADDVAVKGEGVGDGDS